MKGKGLSAANNYLDRIVFESPNPRGNGLRGPYRYAEVGPKERNMKIERRLRALEAKLITHPVVLYFADGGTRELNGPGDFLLRLFRGVFGRAKLSPAQANQLDLIRQCVGSNERGRGRMVELLQCLLHAKADARDGIDLVDAS